MRGRVSVLESHRAVRVSPAEGLDISIDSLVRVAHLAAADEGGENGDKDEGNVNDVHDREAVTRHREADDQHEEADWDEQERKHRHTVPVEATHVVRHLLRKGAPLRRAPRARLRRLAVVPRARLAGGVALARLDLHDCSTRRRLAEGVDIAHAAHGWCSGQADAVSVPEYVGFGSRARLRCIHPRDQGKKT